MTSVNAWSTGAGDYWACNCVGPQNGEPRCPCQMRNIIIRDGRYIEPEKDLGPVPMSQEEK